MSGGSEGGERRKDETTRRGDARQSERSAESRDRGGQGSAQERRQAEQNRNALERRSEESRVRNDATAGQRSSESKTAEAQRSQWAGSGGRKTEGQSAAPAEALRSRAGTQADSQRWWTDEDSHRAEAYQAGTAGKGDSVRRPGADADHGAGATASDDVAKATESLKKAEQQFPEDTINPRYDKVKDLSGERWVDGDTKHTTVTDGRGKKNEKITFTKDDEVTGQRPAGQSDARRTDRRDPAERTRAKREGPHGRPPDRPHERRNELERGRHERQPDRRSAERDQQVDTRQASGRERDSVKVHKGSEGRDALPPQSQANLEVGNHPWDKPFALGDRIYFPDSVDRTVRWIDSKELPDGASRVQGDKVTSVKQPPLGNDRAPGHWIFKQSGFVEARPRFPEDTARIKDEFQKIAGREPDDTLVRKVRDCNAQLNRDVEHFLGRGHSLESALQQTRVMHVQMLREVAKGVGLAIGSSGIGTSAPQWMRGYRDPGRATGLHSDAPAGGKRPSRSVYSAGAVRTVRDAPVSRVGPRGGLGTLRKPEASARPTLPRAASDRRPGSERGEARAAAPSTTGPASAARPRLVEINMKLSGATAGTGGVREIKGLRRPDGGLDVTIKGELRRPLDRKAPTTPNYNTEGVRGSDYTGTAVEKYQVAHLWGPGFGDEARDGLMLAPAKVNQAFQNHGIESRLRELQTLAARQGGSINVIARAEGFPRNTPPCPGTDLLRHASYRFDANLPGQQAQRLGEVDIWVPRPGAAGDVVVEVTPGSSGIWSLK